MGQHEAAVSLLRQSCTTR